MNKKPITAVLKNVVLLGKSLIGEIHADTNGRFADGTTVRTSVIVEQYRDVFITKNSVYYVASWAGPDKDKPIATAE